MKRTGTPFALCLCIIYAASSQPHFFFESGRLFLDPKTGEDIHSPYLSFHFGGERQWTAYDPQVTEGRFLSVSSSYTGAIAGGYIKDAFDFLGKKVVTPTDQTTGVVVSVRPSKELDWMYVHDPGIVESTFNWLVKLRDGMAVVSGWEKRGNDTMAILLCLNKKGEIVWDQRMEHARGFEVRDTRSGSIYWMVVSEKEGPASTLYQIDPFSGEITRSISQPEAVQPDGVRGSVTFSLAGNSLLTGRKLAGMDLAIDQYNYEGVQEWSGRLSCTANAENAYELQGITRRDNGDIQLAVNLKGAISLNGEIFTARSESELLLISLDSEGNYRGSEQYGSEFVGTSGFFQFGHKTGIVGCYKGDLSIQGQKPGWNEGGKHARAYTIYLDEFSPIIDGVDLPVDSTRLLGRLEIYPNPAAEGKITIQNREAYADAPYEIRIYDSGARLQQAYENTTRIPHSRDKLNVSKLASGLFHVYFLQNGAVTSTGKFIINQ